MAKKNAAEVNKSQKIRDYKKAHPALMPKQIASDLGKQGVDVTPGFVSTILSVSKRKPKPGKRGRPKGSTNAKSARAVGRPRQNASLNLDGSLEVDALVKMKELVAQVGGIENARAALVTLERLMD